MDTFFPKKEINQLFSWVRANEHSSFYRDRLPEKNLGSLLDWSNVPLTRRPDIQAVPFWNRVYAAREDIPVIRNTYGTSGTRILITPRTTYGEYSYAYAHVQCVMNFFASGHYDFPRAYVSKPIQSFFGDVGNLEMSAAIATAGGVDMLYITPYTALIFGDILEKHGSVQNIKAVQLCGERCSPLQLRMIKERYPSASVYTNFSSSESRELVAMTCVHDRDAKDSLTMEAADEVYCELVHPETGEIITEEGVHGELVVTTLGQVPFPLIRYATGDIATYVTRSCSCEKNKRGFQMLGRKTVFPVRLVRGELTVDAVESALDAVAGISNAYFEIHYIEEEHEGTVLPRVRLALLADGDHDDITVLEREIEEQIFVFPGFTYAQGIAQEIYLPLTVSFLESAPSGKLGKPKSPIVVRHFAESENDLKQEGLVEVARK